MWSPITMCDLETEEYEVNILPLKQFIFQGIWKRATSYTCNIWYRKRFFSSNPGNWLSKRQSANHWQVTCLKCVGIMTLRFESLIRMAPWVISFTSCLEVMQCWWRSLKIRGSHAGFPSLAYFSSLLLTHGYACAYVTFLKKTNHQVASLNWNSPDLFHWVR